MAEKSQNGCENNQLNNNNPGTMPLYSKKKFAQLCGKSPAHVSTNISRGKIEVSGDYIDTDIPENFELMNKWREQSGLDPIEPTAPTRDESASQAPKTSSTSESESSAPNKSETSKLNREKTRVEIEYKAEKAKETRLKNAKLRGELIPTNMVVDLFAMLGHQFQMQYDIGASELVLELCHKLKISEEIRGEIGEKLTEIINNSHKRAVDEAKMAVRNIISSESGAETDDSDGDDLENE